MLGPDLIIDNIGEFEAIHSKPAYQTTANYAIESIESTVEDRIRWIGHHMLRSLTFVPSKFKHEGVEKLSRNLGRIELRLAYVAV